MLREKKIFFIYIYIFFLYQRRTRRRIDDPREDEVLGDSQAAG